MNRVAVVTGAGTGIGQGIALELGPRGVAVVVHYHSSAQGAQEVVENLSTGNGKAVALQAEWASTPIVSLF